MKITILSCVLLIIFIPFLLYSQELTVIPNGILEKGDNAYVTGDYVRVRSGPSLKNRIITKVNKGTAVTVLKRGERVEKIGSMKNYWYQIKIEEKDLEGWMYGNFLKKRDEKPLKTVSLPSPSETASSEIALKEIGTIARDAFLPVSGDLNQNGITEIILLKKEARDRYCTAFGYEPSSKGFSEIYSIKLRNTSINNIKIFTHPDFDLPIIIASGSNFSYLYSYDGKKNLPRLVYKINTPLVSFGMLDGKNPYLVYLRKNKIIDNDGTITYYITAEKIESVRGRIHLSDKVEYPKPLPVKKLIVFDIDNDKKAEIISEIGGKEFGGGITVLNYDAGGLKRLINTGINTYNDNQFLYMWGINIGKKPKLVIYSTDPSSNNVNADFGFIFASMHDKNLIIESFYPVNKMLDDINNEREVVLYKTDDTSLPFIMMDFNQDSKKYTVKKTVLLGHHNL